MPRTRRTLAVSALLAASATFGAAHAQLGDPTIYEGIGTFQPCSSMTVSQCRRNFAQTPSNKRVLLRNVSCYISSSTPLRRMYLGVSATSGGYTVKDIVVPLSPNTAASGYEYSINAPVYLYVGADRYPYLYIEFREAKNSSAKCSIAGEYVG
jgi:hypothetical protein